MEVPVPPEPVLDTLPVFAGPSRLPRDRDPVAVYLGTLQSSASRQTMAQALREIAGFLKPDARLGEIDWTALRYQHVAALKRHLVERGLRARTVNKMLSAVRGVMRTAWELDLVTHEDFAKVARVKSLRVTTEPVGRRLSFEEISALFNHCLRLGTPGALRDAALVAALVGAGLRRSEVVALEAEHYDPEEKSLLVRGKGNKERVAYLLPDDAMVIEQWVEVRGSDPGPLFCPVGKAGTVSIRAMTTQAVYAAVLKRGREAGLEHFTPHSLRRTLASALLEAGVDVLQVQHQLGHANPATTQRYDLRPATARRDAIRARLMLLRTTAERRENAEYEET